MSGLRFTKALLTGTGLCVLMPIAAEAQTSMQELNDLKAQIEQLKAQQQAAMQLVEQQQAQIDNLINQ